MDNAQFRNLIQNVSKSSDSPTTSSFGKAGLGSRNRAAIPMTPRSLYNQNNKNDLARQIAGHDRGLDGQPALKKFKSSAAPKGTKLAAGYQDRATLRKTVDDGDDTQDDKAKRLKALEEMYKLQQIDLATFEHLKREIGVGGTLESTHLVKGIDWELLAKVRRGEAIHDATSRESESPEDAPESDVDNELDTALDKDVQAKSHAKPQLENTTHGDIQKARVMSRDEILRRFKDHRMGKIAAVTTAEPVLGDKFKKVVSARGSNKERFVETIDGRRREVLIIKNDDGTVKRKTRWIDKEPVTKPQAKPQGKHKGSELLGMEVPAEFAAKQQALLEQEAAEDDDGDIFAGVAEYDPLDGIDSDSGGSEVGKVAQEKGEVRTRDTSATNPSGRPRNYFATGDQAKDEDGGTNASVNDPTFLAAIKRAAGLRRGEAEEATSDEVRGAADLDPQREAKHQALLARLREQDRADAADMDLGFGESRFADDDDDEAGDWDQAESSKNSGHKRGPKKRMGDKDNARDVMSALEGRQKPNQSSK